MRLRCFFQQYNITGSHEEHVDSQKQIIHQNRIYFKTSGTRDAFIDENVYTIFHNTSCCSQILNTDLLSSRFQTDKHKLLLIELTE